MENRYLVTYAYFNKYGYEGQELNRIFVTVNGEMTENTIREIETYLSSKEDGRFHIRVLSFVKLCDNKGGTDKILYWCS